VKRRDFEDRREKERKPRYYRDIKPVKILGVTTDPEEGGEIYFYVKWDSGREPGLVTSKEAYAKMPLLCLKFYESKLIWKEKPPKTEEELAKEKEMSNGMEGVKISEENVDVKKHTDRIENGGEVKEPPSSVSEHVSVPVSAQQSELQS